jgi:PmbA protein
MERLLEIARKRADKVEVYGKDSAYTGASFEDGRLKDIDSSFSSGVGLLIMKDGKLGRAYTRNLIDREGLVADALAALAGGVEAGYELPGAAKLPGLGSYDGGIEQLTSTALAAECERLVTGVKDRTRAQVNVSAARQVETVRVLNSSGADFTARSSQYYCYLSLLYPGSYSSISRVTSAKSFARFPDEDLEYVVDTYNRSAEERKPAAGRTRVLFLPEQVYALAWRLVTATRGKEVFEGVSPLKDKVGKPVLGKLLTVTDEPLNDAWPGARAFDDEGTPCRNTPLFEDGVLRGFYYDRYYAWKAGAEPTGHGFRQDVTARTGPQLGHLAVRPGDKSFGDLLREMGSGVVVAGVLGAHSGNILNGDYSIGLSPGLWVENGEIAGHVKDAMVAGNVYTDLKNVVAVGNRQHDAYMGRFPALLLDGVSFATRG